MPRRNPESYSDNHDASWYDDSAREEQAVHYSPELFPDVREALNFLNQIALLDEATACIQYPAGDPEQSQYVSHLLQEHADRATNHDMRVISFDIDLTLRTGGDYEENLPLIDPQAISQLQQQGYIVGTSSDREPSDQRQTLQDLGQELHFCIPKEMLDWTRQLLPAAAHLHVGDDARRDRDIAIQSGWHHQWPGDFQTP